MIAALATTIAATAAAAVMLTAEGIRLEATGKMAPVVPAVMTIDDRETTITGPKPDELLRATVAGTGAIGFERRVLQ